MKITTAVCIVLGAVAVVAVVAILIGNYLVKRPNNELRELGSRNLLTFFGFLSSMGMRRMLGTTLIYVGILAGVMDVVGVAMCLVRVFR